MSKDDGFRRYTTLQTADDAIDTNTMNRIMMAVMAGKTSPRDAGLPDTAAVKKIWDSLTEQMQQEKVPGRFIPLLTEVPDL